MINPKVDLENIVLKRMEENDSECYILTYLDKQFRINKIAYKIIILMDGTRSFQEISAQLNGAKSVVEIEEIYNRQFKEMGIVEGCIPQKENKKRLLYWKIKLFDIKKLSSIHIFDFLFQAKMYIFFIIVYFLVLLWGIIIFEVESFNFDITMFDVSHLVVCVIIVYISGFFHELGHCFCSGKFCTLEQGSIGIAIYIVTPVWYIDLNNIWNLNKKKKIQINIAGVYFQCIYLIFIMLLAFIFSDKLLFMLAAVFSVFSFLNFVPFIKLDGYWILVDYFDFPNLLNCTIKKFLLKKNQKSKFRQLSKRQVFFFNIYSYCFLGYMVLFASFIMWNMISSVQKIFNVIGNKEIMSLYAVWLIIRCAFSIILIFKSILIIKENIYIMSKK